MLSLMTGEMAVCSGSENNWFRIRRLKKTVRNNVDNGKCDSYNDFMKTKNKISGILETSFARKQGINLPSFLS